MSQEVKSESQVAESSIQQIKVDSIKHLICPHSIFSTHPQNDSMNCIYVHFSAQTLLMDSHLTQRGGKILGLYNDFQVLIRYSICSSTTSLFPAINPYSSSQNPYMILHQGFYTCYLLCWECSFLGYLHGFSLPSKKFFAQRLLFGENFSGHPILREAHNSLGIP